MGSEEAEGAPDLVWLSQRLEDAVPALASLAARCAIPESLRATAWRLFLETVPPLSPEQWPALVAAQREQYRTMRDHAMARLREAMEQAIPDDDDDDDDFDSAVFAASAASAARNASTDSEEDERQRAAREALMAVEDAADQIRGDLERCYPEGAGSHFVQAARQKTMFQILLAWSVAHPQPGYRQGMHELLANVVWVFERSFATTAVAVLPADSPVNALRVDPTFIEEDAFWLFDKIIAAWLPLYDTTSNLVVDTAARVQHAILVSVSLASSLRRRRRRAPFLLLID